MKKIVRNSLQSKAGFTLIELLVVIAIIGILASFLLVNFVGVRERARDAQRKSDIKQIQAAVEFYRSDNQTYPSDLNTLISGTTKYMSSLPKDPSTGNDYDYEAEPGPTTYSRYCVMACLENEQDKDATNSTCNSTTCADGYLQTNP